MKRIKKGFTIVELVIVIGVIGILSAILIPTFVNLTDSAKKAAAKTEVADAYTAYVIDKGTDAKTQPNVCLYHAASEKYYTFASEATETHEAGWDVVASNPYSSDAETDVYNGVTVYENVA